MKAKKISLIFRIIGELIDIKEISIAIITMTIYEGGVIPHF